MNILQSLVDDAMKKKQQLQQQAGRVVHQAGADLNPFDGPRVAPPIRQPQQFSPVAQQRLIARNPTTAPSIIAHGPNMPSMAPTPQFNPIAALPGALKQGAQQLGLATGLGAVRTGTGIAQGLSGLTDLATPGTGTSRVSKALNNLAVNTDQTAQANNVNTAYKVAQVPLNAATFMIPGGAATKAVASIPKVGDALNAVAHIAEPVTNLIDRGAGALATRGATGRIAAAGVHGALQPTNFLNAGGATALQVGTESGKGQRITPGSTAASFGENLALGGALHAAPQAAVEAGHGLQVAGKAVNAATKEATGQTFAGLPKKQIIMDTRKLDLLHNAKQDLVTAHANPSLANDVNHGLRDLQQTHGLDFVTGSRGERLARIQQYLEQNGEAIPKLQAHQEKVAAVKNFAVDHPLGMTSGAVNDAGERIGMNGKPLKTSSEGVIAPDVKEVIDAAHAAVKSGDIDQARMLADSLPEQHAKAIHQAADTAEVELQKGIMDDVMQAAHELPAADSVNAHMQEVAKKLADHFNAPKSLYKLTGAKRTYKTESGSLTVGGDAKAAMDRLINTGDLGTLTRNINVLSDKFGGVFSEISNKIKHGDIDDADYEQFVNEFNKHYSKRPSYSRGRSQADNGSTRQAIKPPAKASSNQTTLATSKSLASKPAPSTKLVPPQPREAIPAPRPVAPRTSAKPPQKSLPEPSTSIDVGQYVKNLSKAQDSARKAGTPTGLAKVKSGSSQVKSKLVDSFAPIEDKLNQKVTAENATSHITPQIDRALRADTIAGQYIKDKGLAKVIQNVPNTKEFDQYLIAKHAADLEKNGIKTGRSSEADKQLVATLKDKYEPHAKAIQQYSQGLLDKAVEYGLVSKQLASNLKEKYPNYVPANRIFGDNELVKPPKGVGGGKASLGSQSVVQRIKGSSRQIESPLDSLIHKTQDVIDQGERNRAAQILTGYKELPGNPFELRELGPSENVGAKHVISVLNNGKTRRFETSKEVADAAKSLSKEQLGLIGKILAVPTRVLRLGATSLNPAFTGANVVKDLASGAINSKNPLRSSVANPRVFVKALAVALNHNSKSYAELVREGAGGTSYDIARNAPKQNVRAIRMDRNAGTRALYTVTNPAQLLRAAENTIGRSEEFSRALQYYGGKSAALAKGANEQSARVLGAHAARNNTVNFARAGDYGRVLNSVLPYLNAGIQGSRTLIRTAGERPLQTATKLAIIGFMPTAATTAWNIATPDRKAAYDDIKGYEKQGNIIIVPPNPKKDASGRWNVIKIPVSQEIANLNNIVRNGVETGMKDGTFKAKQLVGDLIGTTTSLNAENGRQFIGQVTPQAVKPVVESVVNQNLFTGNKIIPDSQKNLDAKDQYGDNTSGTAKVVGRNLNIAPRQIDNAIRTGVGGLGQNLVNTSDNVLSKLGVIKPSDVKGTSFATATTKRFSGAQGSNEYDQIDKQNAELTKQLKSLPDYKQMSPADKAKALNRLTSAVSGTYTSDKALTPKQQAINNGSVNVADYLTPTQKGNHTPIAPKLAGNDKQFLTKYNAMNDDQRKKASTTQNDFEYKYAQAKYQNDKANNKLTRAQDISAQQSVAKAKVGSSFSKDTRDVYGLSKSEVYDLITSDPNGKQIANDLLAYGDALDKAGVATNKFRTSKGVVRFSTASSSGGSSSASISKMLAAFKTPYSDLVKSSTKGAQLARSAGLAKRSS